MNIRSLRPILFGSLLLAAGQVHAADVLRDGGFDSGALTEWYFAVQPGAAATGSVVTDTSQAGGHSARVSVTQASTAPWHVQLGQSGVTLTSGATHRIVFWAKAAAPRPLQVVVQEGQAPWAAYSVHDVNLTTAWTRYQLEFEPSVTVANALFNLHFGAATGDAWIDTVSLEALTQTVAGPSLRVDATQRHPISPDIYGMNFTPPALARSLGTTVDRWGGNTVDTYNWQIGSANTSNDYYFENIADCLRHDTGCDAGNRPYYPTFVSQNLRAGRRPLITLPMVGWVAKDAPVEHPFTCSFPPTQFPVQRGFDPFDPNCGDGMTPGNQPLPANPATAYRRSDAAFAGRWVGELVRRFGRARDGGVALYELGNEPALWNSTHRDIHPEPAGYDELLQRTLDYAAAVKQQDATAKVIAFSEWGWPHFFCSARDYEISGYCSADTVDRGAHGGVPLAEWLLRQLRARDQASGQRLVDYIDVHHYRHGGDTADVTRSLWDPTYVDPSWINDRMELIPRMRRWVADNYPGTRTALTEYNLSMPGQPRVNALVQADVLGIFARERLDLATRWSMPDDGEGAAVDGIHDAFRLYRNYDGRGGRFGDTFLRSTSTNQSQLAVYASQRSSDGKLTIVVINKTANSLASPLRLVGATISGRAEVFQWTGSGIVQLPNQRLARTPVTYPPLSMTLYVVAVE